MELQWNFDKPAKHGFYLVTVQRADGSRFLGYSLFNGLWRTVNKIMPLYGVVCWAPKMKPYEGPEQPTHPRTIEPLPDEYPVDDSWIDKDWLRVSDNPQQSLAL